MPGCTIDPGSVVPCKNLAHRGSLELFAENAPLKLRQTILTPQTGDHRLRNLRRCQKSEATSTYRFSSTRNRKQLPERR